MTRVMLATLGVVLALSGCRCGPPQDECTSMSVRFLAPADGDGVGPSVDVSVRALDANGGIVELDQAQLFVKGPGDADYGAAIDGTILAAKTDFLAVALKLGDNSLKATVRQKGTTACMATGTIAVVARDTTPPALVNKVTFPQDANTDGVLNGAELPAADSIQVKVFVANGSGHKVQVKNGATVVGGPVDVMGGQATVVLDRQVVGATEDFSFFAELTKDGVAVNTIAGNPAAVAPIKVSRVVPTCTNTTKALFGPSDDADATLPGFQLRATGVVDSTIVSVVFRVMAVPAESAAATPTAGGLVSGDVTLPATGDVSYAVTLDGVDGAGNHCSATATTRVDLQPPVVVITSPARPADGGTATIATTPTTVTATVTGVDDGAPACVYRKAAGAARQKVDCSTVTGGQVSLAVPFGADGAFELSVDATDTAGNVGTAAVDVQVALTVCPLAFTKPTSCPAFATAKDLVNGAYPVELQSTGCSGKAVNVFVGASTTPACTGVVGANGLFTCPVPLTSAGTRAIRGEVANQVGSPTTVSCDVTYDPTTPVIVAPATPASGPAILNAQSDTQSSLAGAQARLQFTATVPTGGRVDMCINSAALSGGNVACATGETGWFTLKSNVTTPDTAFTFPEGEYQLKLAVVSNGNWNASPILPMRVDVTAPCVTAAGITLPQDANADRKLNLAELAGAAPRLKFFLGAACADLATAPPQTVAVKEVVAGAVSTLAFNVAADVTRGASSDVTVNLTQNVPAEADLQLFVELTDWVGNKNAYAVSSPAVTNVRIDTVAPVCTVAQPTKVGTYGLADLNAGNLDVIIATSADGVAVPMTFTDGTTPVTKTGTAPAAPSYQSSASFTPTGNATWTLTANCADTSGNTATATGSWHIDAVVPTVAITSPATGATLTSFTPTATATVTGANGQTLCFFGSGPVAGEVSLGCGTVTAGAASVVLNFPKNGTWALVARVTSVGGNAAQSPAITGVIMNSPLCPATLTIPALVNASMVVSGNYTVTGSTTCTGVNTTLKVNTVPAGTVVSSGTGTASFIVPVTDAATYTVDFCVKNTGVNPDSCTSATFTVDTTPPACAITAPVKVGTLNMADVPGGVLSVGVTTSADGVAPSMTFAGTTTTTKPGSAPVGPGFVSTATFNPTGETSWTLTANCADAAGNTATASRTWLIDLVAPTVVINSPAAAANIQFTPQTVSATFVGALNGSQACFFRTALAGARTQVGCATVTAGAASFPVPFTANGSYELAVDVPDAAGNVGTGAVNVTVGLYVCPTAFSRPAQCPAYLTSANLSGSVYSFMTSNGSCTGNAARLSLTPQLADGGVGATTVACNGTVAGTGVFSCDATLAEGNYTVNAQTDNQVGAPSAASCAVAVNLGTPVITSPVMIGANPAVINAQLDTQPAVAGAQRLLQFNALLPAGGHFDVCTTQQLDPVTATNRAACADGVAGWYMMQTNVSSPANSFTFSEGAYQIKIVVLSSAGAAVDASAPVSVIVDVTAPCVLAGSLRLPQDSTADGALNSVELGGASPQVAFKLGCGDTVATLASSDPIVLREVVSGAMTATRFNAVNGFTQAAGEITIPTTITLPVEKNYEFYVRLVDAVGNATQFVAVTDAAYRAARVDTVAPACAITQPTVSQTLLGMAGVPGGNLAVAVDTAIDVGTNGVAMSLVGPSTINHSATPSGAQNTATSSFAVTGTASWTVNATCTDGVGNPATATPRTLTIDLDPPTCSITAPTNATPYSNSTIATSVTVGGADGRNVTLTSTLPVAGTTIGTLVVSAGVAAGSLSYTNGTQTITATVSDTAGNPCVATSPGVVVNSTSCNLSLTGVNANAAGNWLNRSNTTGVGATTATATFSATSSNCKAGEIVTLARTSAPAATIGTLGTDASGNVAFTGKAIVDGETYTLTINNGAGILTTQTVKVDLVAPTGGTVAINTKALASASAPTWFVAPADNENVRNNVSGYFADKDGATAGAQFDLSVATVAGAMSGTFAGTVDVTFAGTSVASQAVASDPQASVSFASLTVPHNAIGTMVISVTDPAGNTTALYSGATTIDVIAPAAPTYTPNFNLVADAQAKRKGLVDMTWSPTYDDGATAASGANSGYDVRWSTSSVSANNGLVAYTDYFGSSAKPEALVAWSANPITKQYKLPPINTYYIVVRAKDEVGNYSAYPSPVPSLANPWNKITVPNPTGGTTETFSIAFSAEASLNTDATPDLAVGAPARMQSAVANVGGVNVFFGKVGFAPTGACAAPDCQELKPYDNMAGAFGTDISAAGDVGNVGAEVKPDLLVSQPNYAATGFQGRAFLYFGGTGATIEDRQMSATVPGGFVEFRCGTATGFASAAKILKDINGDGLDDIAFVASAALANQGQVYIFKGRTAAAWDTARTALDGTNKYVPCAGADWTLNGPAAIATGGNQFGQWRSGLVTLGQVKGDVVAGHPVNDFAIPASKEYAAANATSINSDWLYSGLAATTSAVTDTSAARRLAPTPPTGLSGLTNAFGRAALGGLNLLGGAAPDLVVAYPQQTRLHLFTDLVAADLLPANGGTRSETVIQGGASTYFGFVLGAGDINGDGSIDLVVSEVPLAAVGIPGRAWVLYQQLGAYETSVGAGVPAFWVSEIKNMTAGSRQGRFSATGDVNGDGASEVILSDESLNNVQIYSWQ